MPAVTADPSTLPRLTASDAARTPRPVRTITTAPQGLEGDGFPVRRAFAGVSHADLDPFIHMDQMGPVSYGPNEARGTDWHPHRGFETVTYIMDGAFQHQDSHGGGGLITDGDTQWMTAGSGLLHIECPPRELVDRGGFFHGVQLWVNLPAKDKWIPPAYQGIGTSDITLVTDEGARSVVRIIAGDIGGFRGPGSTFTPITLAHVTVLAGATITLPWQPAHNCLVYALLGNGAVGEQGRILREGQLAVMGEGDGLALAASPGQDLDVLILGGQPIREPVVQYGPFVMNTREEIIQTIDDFNAGLLGRVPADGLRVYHGRGRA